MQNINTIKGSDGTTFDRSSFYEELDSFSCLLLDLDVLENIPSWSYPRERGVEESRLCKLRNTHKGPFNDGKGVTHQVLLTKTPENLMNKL